MAKQNKFAAAGKKKAKVRGPFIEHVRRDKLLQRHDGLCGICTKPVNPKKFEVDHIIPVCKGGQHAYWNCQPAHPICNRLKGNLMPEQVVLIQHLIDSAKRKKERYRNNGLANKRKVTARAASQPTGT